MLSISEPARPLAGESDLRDMSEEMDPSSKPDLDVPEPEGETESAEQAEATPLGESAVAPALPLYRKVETEGFGALCQTIAASTALETVIISAIVTNTLILCFQNPANQFDEDMTLLLTVMDLVLSVIFTLEMLIRIRAMGFIGHRGYLDVSLVA